MHLEVEWTKKNPPDPSLKQRKKDDTIVGAVECRKSLAHDCDEIGLQSL